MSYDGIRQYVQISSAAVYGNLNCAGNENMYLTPLSPYAISKVAMEYIGELFGQLNDIDVVSLRIYNIYGYNKFAKENASNLIHNLVSFALENRNAMDLFTIGSNLREMREAKKVTQLQVVEALNVSYTHYAKIEEGIRE